MFRDGPVQRQSYYRIGLDGKRVAILRSNQYTQLRMRPGPRQLSANVRVSLARDTFVRFDEPTGATVCYRLNVPFFGRPSLDRVADDAPNRALLARLKRVAPEVEEPIGA